MGCIKIAKTMKDGTKLRKMSTGVQIWTRLDWLKVANLAAIESRVGALISCAVAPASIRYAFSQNVFCIFQWQSIQKN
jgi:hypothetical protein